MREGQIEDVCMVDNRVQTLVANGSVYDSVGRAGETVVYPFLFGICNLISTWTSRPGALAEQRSSLLATALTTMTTLHE